MKASQWIPSALLGFTLLACGAMKTELQAQTVTGTNTIAMTDFDSNVPGWDYGYFYSWGWGPDGQYTNGTWLVNRMYDDSAKGGTMCMRYEFTNSPFYELVTTNSGAGYGTGFGGPQAGWGWDASVFNSISPDHYLFSFDARAEGLADGITAANCEMQCQITGSGGNPKYLQKNFAFGAGSNWTHFTFTFADGSFGDNTTWQNFTNNLPNIVEVRFNVNLHMPNGEVGWDDYNVVLLDNIQLAVLQVEGPPPPTPPTVPFVVFEWNMDDKPLGNTFGGYNWSQNSYLPIFDYFHNIDPNTLGVGGSTAWYLSMDNSALAAPNTPQWAGGGTGGSGPVDFTMFTDNNLSRYVISFDARVEGLIPDVTGINVAMQLFMDSPNGNVRLDFPVNVESNWVHFAFTFNAANWDTGGGRLGKASFSTNYNTYTALRTQWQIENAQSPNWGYDTDNILVVDNIKLTHDVVGCPPIRAEIVGSNVVLTWGQPSNGTSKLQSASSLGGPYIDVSGATSPYSIPAASAPNYFRTKWVPPAM